MTDRAVIRAGAVGAVLAAICCAAPLLAVGLSLAGLGTWLTGVGAVVLPLIVAAFGFGAWGPHHRRARATAYETKIRKEGVKP